MNNEYNILVIDDVLENRKALATILSRDEHFNVFIASNGPDALEMLTNKKNNLPDIILLDIMMPEMSGFEVASAIKSMENTKSIPIIFITALAEVENKIKAFKLGGADYITKPFYPEEVISRIRTHLNLKNMIENLEGQVKERTYEIEQINLALISALINANYYNDDETGNHIKRVGNYSRILAEGYGLPAFFVSQIERYAPLHDIGKVGIPDLILKKPDKLSREEYDQMKTHCEIGFNMINNPAVSEIVKNIVLYHHEKWDGSGYPYGLKGEEIPIEGRIVALADVFDALRSKRVYKPAFSREKTDEIIISSAGSHFDPGIVGIYEKNREKFHEIFEALKDNR